jgi:hypothetical protein
VITAAGGILLAVRAARDKERKAAQTELGSVEVMLGEERHARLVCELRQHHLELLLARHGIDPDRDA